MNAQLPGELIELLEKIVFECPDFAGNRHLQNLLILTAIKADENRVMDYINRLDSYDAPAIAGIAIESGLFEAAFVIYKKSQFYSLAIDVLIKNVGNIERADEFADRINQPEVYSKLGKAQLDRKLVNQAITSFIKASDHQYFPEVIEAAEQANLYDDLVRFLQMARTKGKEPTVDTELIWALAKTDNLRDLDDFISLPHCANIQHVGERCYSDGLYKAAKILFNNIANFARLATTLVKLEEYSAGVDAATKANNIRTWKEVCTACVEAKQFRLAQICGLHIVIRPDELEEIIGFYEIRGHFEEVIALLEAGLISDRSHPAMFTELAILYSKYKPDKLMEHLRIFHTRINMLKVLRVCEKNHQWPELTFLYVNRKEFDSATMVMIDHSVDAWEHGLFKEISPKVASAEILYKAIQFYLEEHPLMINDLLTSYVHRVDHTRVINLVRKLEHLPVIKPYLLSIQHENIPAVNNAINDLLIEEEDFEALRASIDTHDNIETVELANRLEQHDFLEFRRIAAYLYKKNKKWQKSIDLSKFDKNWKDAIETASASQRPEVVENLLRFFVSEGRKDCFTACLFSCFDFISPDVVIELSWKHGMMDFAMPFFVQTVRNMNNRLSELEKRTAPKEEVTQVAQPADLSMGLNVVPPFSGFAPAGFTGAPAGFAGVPPGAGAFVPPGVPAGFTGVPPGSAAFGVPGSLPPNFGVPPSNFVPANFGSFN